jgi:hypothetical protein
MRPTPTSRSHAASAVATLAAVALAGGGCGDSGSSSAASPTPRFSDPGTIDNRYLPLTAKRRCEQRGVAEDGTRMRSVLTVLDRAKRFDVGGQAVDAVVIRDDAYEDGELVETTLDYFAQADDGTVYYLGEDVQNVKSGRVVDTDGTWLYGADTDVLGVAMPADPEVGDRYRFEDVPAITTESNRVEESGLRAQAAGKLHTDVIRIQEFIQPEGEVEYKLYAPGVGKIVEYAPEGRSELVGCR